ncbi:DEAD/DEAH box helicase [Georgenia sp. SUBG003]|uniref:DEAD/DEAH box helicase n=1 Tax=Georgenia sp. SUBG003 TaxID=1497974 RepID=UPI003AB8BC58
MVRQPEQPRAGRRTQGGDMLGGPPGRRRLRRRRRHSGTAEAAWAHRHTVVATGTGSGKSLAAWLPAVSAVRAGAADAARPGAGSIAAYDRRPTTLYLSPTKALAADQLTGLHRLLDAAGLRAVRVTTCDGDTPLEERDWARDHADVVLSNPDFLHFSMLPGHRRWQRLLKGLRYVVVDECHAYRGVLGAHVALVLRRLLRLAARYGATPTVLAASATTAEPALTARRARARLPATVRGHVGVVTSAGRVVRLDVLDAPGLPPAGAAPSLSGGVPLTELLALEKDEEVVGLARLDDDAAPLVLATAGGVVKRVTSDRPANKDSWQVIALGDGDRVVGCGHAADGDRLVLVSSDAHLLRFDASAVRPQGRAGRGMAGMRLGDRARVIHLGIIGDDDVSASVVDAGPEDERRPGRLVVVWGPPGAPGRTTLAVTLAAELAVLAGSANLVDADTEAPSVTQVLGILDDASAVAAVARQALNGRLDPTVLRRLCPVVDGNLHVMTGLTRADRWRELPAAALEVVWDVARASAPWTVVDTGATLDGDPDGAYGPRRHAATASALAAADVVVVVGAGEPVGMRRLVMALGELSDATCSLPARPARWS